MLKLFHTVRALDESLFDMAGGGGKFGRGGMLTKVRAARLAAKSGCPTLIASGESDNVLARLMDGEMLGTLFITDNDRITAHQQWLAAHLQTAGSFRCWMMVLSKPLKIIIVVYFQLV